MKINDWLKGNKLGMDIWENKYRHEDETFEEWLDRVSAGNNALKELIVERKFLFGGRILANRGIAKGKGMTYSNCYVITPPQDNIESIWETASKLARTFSYGGGCGVDISNLRPKGMPVNNSAKTTSGAVSFMDVFEQTARVIGQKGRRGALMISMDCNHPDLEDFINAKLDNKLEKCNISVMMDDNFMYMSSKGGEEERLFHLLAQNNYDYAEPGMLFWERIQEYNLLSEFEDFEYAGVNPCAEEPLPAGGSCLLGALNLAEFVINPFTNEAEFDYHEFENAVRTAVIALNDVLDEGLELHPLQEQRDSVRDWRQIGLGFMGFADMLLQLGVNYGSTACMEYIEDIGHTLVKTGIMTSCAMAIDKGAFPKCDGQKILESKFMESMWLRSVFTDTECEMIRKYGLRNSQLFTIAPTGSISTMLGISGGVEPIFATSYTRKTQSLHGEEVTYKVYTPIIGKMIEEGVITEDEEKDVKTAQNINPMNRVRTQAKWQEYIDASISSTVNVTNETTVEEIEGLYKEAWLRNCKGLTIYRAGCKKEGILVTEGTKVEAPKEVEKVTIVDTDINNCVAQGTKLMTGCGSLWITAYFHKETGQLCHIFLDKGSTGGCNSFMIGLSRLISLAGKKGASIDEIVEQLNSVATCPSYAVRRATKGDTSPGTSCPVAIGKALKVLYDRFNAMENVVITEEAMVTADEAPKCPKCGEELQFTGGCNSCPGCGYSKCD